LHTISRVKNFKKGLEPRGAVWKLIHRQMSQIVNTRKMRSIALEWLLKHGYIERQERGIYRITEKGLRFLETL
jgi:CTP-dependent riboflavin kinase